MHFHIPSHRDLNRKSLWWTNLGDFLRMTWGEHLMWCCLLLMVSPHQLVHLRSSERPLHVHHLRHRKRHQIRMDGGMPKLAEVSCRVLQHVPLVPLLCILHQFAQWQHVVLRVPW
uniref:Uncharacterized protein n=1 Tax=Eutreptiella gymnastica TaxID=73025 RepID=A0A7S4CVE0_9EUGL